MKLRSGTAAAGLRALGLLAGATLLMASSPSPDPADDLKERTVIRYHADDGLALARKLCATCHLIGDPAAGPLAADVPSFAQVANRPQQTFDGLIGWLSAPHAPMPDPHLTRQEMGDLATYIMSLRTEK